MNDLELPNSITTKQKGHKIIIDFIRHGKAVYNTKQRPKNKKDQIEFEGVLTKKGLKQIEVAAKKIIERIDNKSKELVILWRSPKQRTEESTKKLKETLLKNGVNVFPKKYLARKNPDLTDLKLTEEFLEEYEKQLKQNKDLNWIEFWKEESANFKNVENEKDFTKRMRKLIFSFQQFSQKTKLSKNIKIRFICLTHEEEIKNIAELFDIFIKNIENGEIMEMNVNPQKNTSVEFSIDVQEQKGYLESNQLFKENI